jgi:LysR family transcriptional regulator, nitrogen assimilation regulatory protein
MFLWQSANKYCFAMGLSLADIGSVLHTMDKRCARRHPDWLCQTRTDATALSATAKTIAMQLRHLHYFVKIVEAGSFSRAATTIHVAQPALSQQIAELEHELNVTLLYRSARGVRPTPAGDILFREAVSILGRIGQLRTLVRSSDGEIAGAVNLGASSTLASTLFGPFGEACRTALPKVTLRYSTSGGMSLMARLEAHTLDLVVTFEDELSPLFARQPLFRQRLYLVRHEALPGEPASVSLQDLTAMPLVLPMAPNVVRGKLDRVFAAAGLAPRVVAEADVLSSLMSAVQTGIGATILPKGDFSDVPGYATLAAALVEPPMYLTAAVLWSAETPLTPAGEAVRNLLQSFIDEQFLVPLPAGAERIAAAVSAAVGDSAISA